MKHFSHEQARTLVALCAGATFFIAIAVLISSSAQILPRSTSVAINTTLATTQQAAAVGTVAPFWKQVLPGSGVQGGYGNYPGYTACTQHNSDSSSFDPNCYVFVNPVAASIESLDNSIHAFAYWSVAEGGGGAGYNATAICNSGNPDLITYVAPPRWSYTAPAAITVPVGQTLQLDWSCMPSQQINSFYCGHQVQWAWGGPQAFEGQPAWATSNFTSAPPTITATDGEMPSTGGQYYGSTIVTPTAAAGTTVTYTVHCSGSASNPAGTWAHDSSIAIPVNIIVPPTPGSTPPTATIDAGAGSGITKTVNVGTQVTVTAAYTPGAEDSLNATAINDDSTGNSVPCSAVSPYSSTCWENPDAQKTYTFTPTQPGTYTFSAQIRATHFVPPGCTGATNCYNSYGTVTVNVVCPSGGSVVGGVPGGSSGSASCGTPTCPDPHQVGYPTCSCEFGYKANGSGACIPATCSDPNAVPPTCTVCSSGYTYSNGSCRVAPPTLSITVSQAHVRKGAPANVSWSTNGLSGSAGTSCSVTSSPSNVFSATMPSGTKPSWGGSNVATNPIGNTTTFTLSCTGVTPVSATVMLLPTYQEQ